MTKREFYEAIVSNETLSDDIRTIAQSELTKLDAHNSAAMKKRNERHEADQPIVDALTAALGDEPIPTSELAVTVGVSTPKASALLRRMVDAGIANVCDVKGKKGMVKGYTLA